jgi:hypothetical protein
MADCPGDEFMEPMGRWHDKETTGIDLYAVLEFTISVWVS